jgi:methylenetetrahydrofolate reductase (NADPH)
MTDEPEAATSDTAKQQIVAFMTGFTAETTPGAAAKTPDYREHLRPGTVVYITFLPGSEIDDTIAVAKRLKGEGFLPVPHFAARSVPDAAFLEDKLARLTGEAGLEQVLVIAGAVDTPAGDFADTMQLLETGLFDKHGIRKFGVAGHPEGCPDISDQAIAEALRWKNDFAERSGAELYLVTQFCFEAGPVIEWDRRIQAEGNRLPVIVGVPGLATIKTLLGHAKACGIGPSLKFLTRQARNLTKLMTVSTPDRLVTDLAAYQASDPGCGIAGVHVYPLGGLRRSAKWSYAVTDGAFTMKRDGTGFSVDIDLG